MVVTPQALRDVDEAISGLDLPDGDSALRTRECLTTRHFATSVGCESCEGEDEHCGCIRRVPRARAGGLAWPECMGRERQRSVQPRRSERRLDPGQRRRLGRLVELRGDRSPSPRPGTVRLRPRSLMLVGSVRDDRSRLGPGGMLGSQSQVASLRRTPRRRLGKRRARLRRVGILRRNRSLDLGSSGPARLPLRRGIRQRTARMLAGPRVRLPRVHRGRSPLHGPRLGAAGAAGTPGSLGAHAHRHPGRGRNADLLERDLGRRSDELRVYLVSRRSTDRRRKRLHLSGRRRRPGPLDLVRSDGRQRRWLRLRRQQLTFRAEPVATFDRLRVRLGNHGHRRHARSDDQSRRFRDALSLPACLRMRVRARSVPAVLHLRTALPRSLELRDHGAPAGRGSSLPRPKGSGSAST